MIVLVDFNTTTGTDRDDYECWPHASKSRMKAATALQRCESSEVEDSWVLVPEAGLAPLELVHQSGDAGEDRPCTRIQSLETVVHNCRAFRSAEFAETDHRLRTVTLKIRLKSRKMAPSSQGRSNVRRSPGGELLRSTNENLRKDSAKETSSIFFRNSGLTSSHKC